MSGSKPLSLAEIDQIADALTTARDRAAFLLSCGCGLRSGTLLSLRLAQIIDRDHCLTGYIDIPRASMKGKRRAHRVNIPARALRALGLWIAEHPAPHRAAPLFPSSKNPDAPITTRHWRRVFQEACQEAKITGRVSPHSTRKFFAHAIYEETDKDIQLTTRALGNKSPMSTMHYLDFGQRRIALATLTIFDDRAQLQLLSPQSEQKTSSPN